MTTLVEQLINDLEAEITQRDARIEEQAREIEIHAEVVAVESSLRASAELDLATLKSQSSGVALPIRKSEAAPPPFERGWNACLDEVARLNSPPTSAGDLFWKEKLAVKFCEQRCVSDDAPERAGLVDAFITGLSIGSKQPISAGVVDERAAFEAWAKRKYPLSDRKDSPGGFSRDMRKSALDGWQARAELAAQPDNSAQIKVQICNLGNYGAAYDAPGTCRAYTYAAQPGNDIAYRLGDCLRAARADGGGDRIDYGLALLRQLHDRGFGVFQIAAPTPGKEIE